MKPNGKAKVWVDEALDWEKKVYKNPSLCIGCKNAFFSKPYDHRDAVPGQIGYCVHCDNCLIKDQESKMEFQRERVYTALNADELKQGDKVIVARSLSLLKTAIENTEKHIKTLEKINNEEFAFRFVVNNTTFPLAYLVERKENCTNCGKTECSAHSEHDDFKVAVCSNWIPKAEPKTEPKAEKKCETCRFVNCGFKDFNHDNNCDRWEAEKKCGDCTADEICVEGKKIYKDASCPYHRAEPHYRPFKDTDELIKVWGEKIGSTDYWGKGADLTMPLIWVRRKEANTKGQLITNFGDSCVVVSGVLEGMQTLFTDFTFLDGSVCGVEE